LSAGSPIFRKLWSICARVLPRHVERILGRSQGSIPQRSGEVSDAIVKHRLPEDNSGITVEFFRYFDATTLGGTAVVFRIPDSAQILSRDPVEFMRWCYEQMMTIGRQARGPRA
jgi:hypothetical protein